MTVLHKSIRNMKYVHQLLGVFFCIFLAVQITTSATHGHGTHNFVGTTILLAFLTGLIGLCTVNIIGIITSSGTTLHVSKEKMANAFFLSTFIVGMLLSIQATLSLSGSEVVFIPSTIETIITVLVVGGLLSWVGLAAIFWIMEALGAFSTGMAKEYGWLIAAGVLAFGLFLYFSFQNGSFSNISLFSKENALFKPTKEISQKKDAAEPDVEQIAEHAKKADKPAEAEEHKKKVDQVISDDNGVTVSQSADANGNIKQHIDADEPDGK